MRLDFAAVVSSRILMSHKTTTDVEDGNGLTAPVLEQPSFCSCGGGTLMGPLSQKESEEVCDPRDRTDAE